MSSSAEEMLRKQYRNLRKGWNRLCGGDGQRQVAVDALTKVYSDRPDLQEVYPEAADGKLGRLLGWAAGVAAGKWDDSSHVVLKPYLRFYRLAATETDPGYAPIPWSKAQQTSAVAANPMPITLQAMADERADAISSHLMTLALLVREFGLKNIVELGTYNGNSTLVFLEAARAVDGQVTSIDLQPCPEARQRVEEAGLAYHWIFLQGDDLLPEPPQLPNPIDLLLIDTNHIYSCTMAELNKYVAYLRDGSWIALHDYASFPGVNQAVDDFVRGLGAGSRFYVYMHQHGLALLRVGRSDGG